MRPWPLIVCIIGAWGWLPTAHADSSVLIGGDALGPLFGGDDVWQPGSASGPVLDGRGDYVAAWVAAEPGRTSDCAHSGVGACGGILLHDFGASETFEIPPGRGVDSRLFAMSRDGMTIVFASVSDAFDASDEDGQVDVFAYDVTTTTVERISVPDPAVEGRSRPDVAYGSRDVVSVSADGRFVVFTSASPDLVPDDVNGRVDVFLRDRVAGTIERVSLDWKGNESRGDSGRHSPQAVSDDGRFVVFANDGEGMAPGVDGSCEEETPRGGRPCYHVYLFDRDARRSTLVDVTPQGRPASGGASFGAISGDGLRLAFTSEATDIIPVVSTTPQAYHVQREGGPIKLVHAPAWAEDRSFMAQGALFSSDGRYLSYQAADLTVRRPGADASGPSQWAVHDLEADVTWQVAGLGPGSLVREARLWGPGFANLLIVATPPGAETGEEDTVVLVRSPVVGEATINVTWPSDGDASGMKDPVHSTPAWGWAGLVVGLLGITSAARTRRGSGDQR